MNKINYSKEFDKYIDDIMSRGLRPRLLLHACCAPCSSYCLELLRQYFDVTLFYYNPNITNEAEYRKRTEEARRLVEEYNRQVIERDFEGMNSDENASLISFMEGKYDPENWLSAVKGMEDIPEGGDRCTKCFMLRLDEAGRVAAEGGFDLFTTTLTISPLKNADKLNLAGREAADKYGIFFLPSDFKKKNGYKRSIELSKRFDLYRQDYCGCAYSKAQREREKALKDRQ
ncbi:epoxyqueuosine reductase QueH [Butyrivibrio sp. MC2013]|uniref:epoxyqueuosine reductase QueH n=1 Tax=Butyrivibrio sp. MC2013 TaxID=1280686 RepID=UPI0004790983|nr:epoxyqueuosine reductase QueH [Butyrivibrio sp. MC2013]